MLPLIVTLGVYRVNVGEAAVPDEMAGAVLIVIAHPYVLAVYSFIAVPEDQYTHLIKALPAAATAMFRDAYFVLLTNAENTLASKFISSYREDMAVYSCLPAALLVMLYCGIVKCRITI